MKLKLDSSVEKFQDFIMFSILTALIFFCSIYKIQSEFIVGLGAIAGILLLVRLRSFIFICMIFSITNDIYPKESFVFEVLGIKQIFGIYLTLYYIINFNKINNKFNRYAAQANIGRAMSFIFLFIYLLLFYYVYTFFKNAFWGLQEYNYSSAILKSINIFLFLFTLIPLIKIAVIELTPQTFLRYVIYSIIFMLIFSYLSPQLPDMGFKSNGSEEADIESSMRRIDGIIPSGDSNTLGMFFVMSFSICLMNYKRFYKPIFFSFMAAIVLIIALTGSRTSFITLIFVSSFFILFMDNKKYGNTKYIFLFAFPAIMIIISPYLELVLERLQYSDQQLDTETESNRIGKWILYVNHFLENPSTFIHGSKTELRIAWDGTFYAAHNALITITYNAGLFFSISFVIMYIKMLRYSFNKNNQHREWLLIIFPYLFLTNTVSDLGIVYSFVLFSALLLKLKYWPPANNFAIN